MPHQPLPPRGSAQIKALKISSDTNLLGCAAGRPAAQRQQNRDLISPNKDSGIENHPHDCQARLSASRAALHPGHRSTNNRLAAQSRFLWLEPI